MAKGVIARLWHTGGVALANLFILNLLFLSTSLAVVTIFPSVFAVFSVVREWADKGEQGVVAAYFGGFKRHFWRSYAMGLPTAAIGSILYIEMSVYGHRHGIMSLFMLALCVSVSLVYVIALIYLLPTAVSSSNSVVSIVEFAIFCGIRNIGTTIVRTLPALFLMAFVTAWIPALFAFGMLPAMCWFVYVSSRPMRCRFLRDETSRTSIVVESERAGQIGG